MNLVISLEDQPEIAGAFLNGVVLSLDQKVHGQDVVVGYEPYKTKFGSQRLESEVAYAATTSWYPDRNPEISIYKREGLKKYCMNSIPTCCSNATRVAFLIDLVPTTSGREWEYGLNVVRCLSTCLGFENTVDMLRDPKYLTLVVTNFTNDVNPRHMEQVWSSDHGVTEYHIDGTAHDTPLYGNYFYMRNEGDAVLAVVQKQYSEELGNNIINTLLAKWLNA